MSNHWERKMNAHTEPPRKTRRPPLADSEIDFALALIADGAPLSEAARTLSTTPQTLNGYGVHSGHQNRPTRRWGIARAKLSTTPQRDAGLTA